MYKVKTEWYFAQSKSHLALPTTEREMWLMVSEVTEYWLSMTQVLDQKIDDVLPQLSEEVRAKVQHFLKNMWEALDGYAQQAGKKKVWYLR